MTDIEIQRNFRVLNFQSQITSDNILIKSGILKEFGNLFEHL